MLGIVRDMRAVLYYRGNLPSSANNKEKHSLRMAFHPQLEELWCTDPVLQDRLKGKSSIEAIWWDIPKASPLNVGHLSFVPLVTADLDLLCYLDVMIMMRESQQIVKAGGDLDNRLKGLLDSLRVPNVDQVKGVALEDKDPLYCLLEDDKLISGLQIRTERWLEPPETVKTAHHVQVKITAVIRPTRVTYKNIGFLGGFLERA